MSVLALVLGVFAAIAIVVTLVLRHRLRTQRRLTAAADAVATNRAGELATATARLTTAEHDLAAAAERATAAEEGTAYAEERAGAAEQELEESRDRAIAEERGRSPAVLGVLWELERSRSARTWRQSVAVDPDDAPALADAEHPLVVALGIELDAAREDIGAVVELDADVPADVPARTSLLVLRIAQELLADIVRRSEETTLSVRRDGADVLVTARGVDETGAEVAPAVLDLTPTSDVEPVPGGVRLRHALGDATDDADDADDAEIGNDDAAPEAD
ncbi:MAG: hypothetical protein H0U21_12805 [Acidimicrobiia bacterium]|nr:hypothetical protein [Acidimicrobiia bacterium]